MSEKIELTIAEKIDRAKDGRSQTWIVSKMNELGCSINEVQFSRKKKGGDDFSDLEKKALFEILSVSI